jgi:histidine triad (HIT) family protein
MPKGIHFVFQNSEIDKIFDMDEAHYLGLMHFSRKIAITLEQAVLCKRIGMSVIGLEVHTLDSMNEMDEMRFQNKVSLTKESFKHYAKHRR